MLVELTDFREVLDWRKTLVAARNEGIAKNSGKKTRKSPLDPFEKKLNQFEREESQNDLISAEAVRQAVVDLSELLKKQNVDEDLYLDQYHQRLLAILEYAADRAQARYVQLLNELHTSFGSNEIEPTKMGNIARTIQSYALRRYQCNLEAVWSNLQRVVQKDDKANAALLESKTQLDFLVSCCWLTLLWSLVWAIVFAFVVKSRIGFLSAALGGPLVAYMWYRIAAEQYRSFADVAMTTLDVFRFALLEQMRLGIAFKMIRERDPTKHFKALRYLGANTRLAEKLLVKPENVSLEESYLLDQELKKLDGKYLKEDVATKMAVEVDNVSDWPDIEPTESFPVETQTEPDWLLLNQGSLVQVWVNNKPSPHRARVLAIIPSGKNWMVLLNRHDIAALLAGAKEPHVLRLEQVAGR